MFINTASCDAKVTLPGNKQISLPRLQVIRAHHSLKHICVAPWLLVKLKAQVVWRINMIGKICGSRIYRQFMGWVRYAGFSVESMLMGLLNRAMTSLYNNYAVNSNHVAVSSGLVAIFNAKFLPLFSFMCAESLYSSVDCSINIARMELWNSGKSFFFLLPEVGCWFLNISGTVGSS